MKIRSKAEVCRRLEALSHDFFSVRNEMWCVNVTDVSISLTIIWRKFLFLVPFNVYVKVTHPQMIFIEWATCVKLKIYEACPVSMHCAGIKYIV